MSWIKKLTSKSPDQGRNDGVAQNANNSSPSLGSDRSSRSSSISSNQTQGGQGHPQGHQHQGQPQHQVTASLTSSPARQHRNSTDPATCLVVFKSHWAQALAIINKTPSSTNGSSPAIRRSANEELEAVLQYADQMVLLMIEEEEDQGGQGPILQYLLEEDIMVYLLTWTQQSERQEHADRVRLHHLKMFETMISQSRQSLFVHKPLIRPLLKLLTSCASTPQNNKQIETRLILVLHQLCVCVTQNTQMLELLFSASSDQGPAKFVIFSLLIPYIHREGPIGQQARDALLLIMALSCVHDHIGIYIAENSDFCPVLATGLSGLYSSLQRKFENLSDDWHRLGTSDVQRMPDLVHFLNSLEFCNAVVQVAHPMLRDQLLLFIHQGFLRPQLGPALFQDIFKLPISLVENYFASSMDEVIAATAYLDLFIRTVTEPALIRTFLKFILTEKHDDVPILESLIGRINSHSRLCMVTLSLFETLVTLNCEDVMYQLVFKFLIPCTHVMVSQRRAVKDVDMYSKTAEKLLTLKPACCTSDYQEMASTAESTPASSQPVSAASSRGGSPTSTPTSSRRSSRLSFWKKDRTMSVDTPATSQHSMYSQSTPDHFSITPAFGSKLEHFETDYMDYLRCVRPQITLCVRACQCWSAPYDGENPSPDSLLLPIASGTSIVETEDGEGEGDGGKTSDGVKEGGGGGEKIKVDGQSEQSESDKGDKRDNKDGLSSTTTIGATTTITTTTTDTTTSSSSPPTSTVTSQGKDSTSSSSSSSQQAKLSLSPSALSKTTAAKELHHQYAESTVSEADSALSGSSNYTENNTGGATNRPASRTDSPLNDDSFDNADFTAFLASLQRVKTPVEFGTSFEDCLQEIDCAADLAKAIGEAQPTSTSSSKLSIHHRLSESSSLSSSYDPSQSETHLSSKSSDAAANKQPPKSSASLDTDLDGKMTRFDSLLNLDTVATSTASATSQFSAVKGGGAGTVFTPTKYNLGKPDIGPFLSTLLSKLESMMQNSLYVNLLLTGLVTRLAYYPQPLLRSFLLNHTLVFQPTVKSLVQVLGAVKHKVDCYSYQVAEFDALLLKARKFMAWREESLLKSVGGGRDRSVSMASTPLRGTSLAALHKEKKRSPGNNAISDFFRRNTPARSSLPANQSRLQFLGKQNIRYINQRSKPAQEPPANDLETLKTKNAVYCALVLEEFVKELAAISQEHAVVGNIYRF